MNEAIGMIETKGLTTLPNMDFVPRFAARIASEYAAPSLNLCGENGMIQR